MRSLQAQVDGVVVPEAPSEQAVRILSSAQQTADNYVAEAEEFSRQVTSEARAEYEERCAGRGRTPGRSSRRRRRPRPRSAAGPRPPADVPTRSVAELQEQVAYLKAFGQAVRVQLRSYLEALLSDVETRMGPRRPGRPAAVGSRGAARRPPAQRSGRQGGPATGTSFEANTVPSRPTRTPGTASSRWSPSGSEAR